MLPISIAQQELANVYWKQERNTCKSEFLGCATGKGRILRLGNGDSVDMEALSSDQGLRHWQEHLGWSRTEVAS